MKKTILTIGLLMTMVIGSLAQTKTKPDLYKGMPPLNLRVSEYADGSYMFSYQNTTYTQIIEREYFVVNGDSAVIMFLDKLLFILDMEKTQKDVHIKDTFNTERITRYSFAQKVVYVDNKNNVSVQLKRKQILKIRAAILSK
mgnify:CR=1 FL=1